MTEYHVFRPDGSIEQALKIFDLPQNYDNLLNERSLSFVKTNTGQLASHEHWMVDVKTNQLTERPVMPITVNKTIIQAGDTDSALFTGIPKGVTYSISAAGAQIYPIPGQNAILDGDELEISIPVPCTYTVTLNLWPFKTFVQQIQAVTT